MEDLNVNASRERSPHVGIQFLSATESVPGPLLRGGDNERCERDEGTWSVCWFPELTLMVHCG